jgi:gliding motility-associated-like protein
MKQIFTVLFTVIFSIFIIKMSAQNLVPNYNFEENTGLPMTSGEWYKANNWDNVNGLFDFPYASPDYLHNFGGAGVNLPATSFANVYAHEGEAIFGFAAYHTLVSEFREYLSAELIEPMIPGLSYTVSFYITNGESDWYGAAGCDHIGIQFSEGPLTQITHEPIGGIPQIEIPGIYWNTEWELFTFTYIADAPYDRITIGNFYDDSDTDVEIFGGVGIMASYYFLDEIMVVPLAVITEIDTTICSGITYTLPDGTTTDTAGVFTSIIVAADGSDSTVITNLFIAPNDSTTVDVAICLGESYTLPDGTVVDADGIYTTNLISVLGCDSTIITNLLLIPFFTTTVDTAICSGDVLALPDGTLIVDAGTYTSVLISMGGCDSIIITNVALNDAVNSMQDINICSGASYMLPDGSVVSDAGTYISVLTAISGCDSIITTNLNVVDEINIFVTNDICEGEIYTLPDGTTTTISGIYENIFTSTGGCDSSIVTTLTVHPQIVGELIMPEIICIEAAPVILNGSPSGGLYSGVGVVDDTFNPSIAGVGGPYIITYIVDNAFGCGDTVQAAITVMQNTADAGIDSTIFAGETAILSGTSGGDYIWSPSEQMNCFNCAVTEVNPFVTTTYTLSSIDVNGCVATDTVTIFVEGSTDVIIPNAFSANNDGVNDVFHVVLQGATINHFSIYDRWGKLVYTIAHDEVNWDGNLNNTPLEMGVYVYAAEFVINGDIITKSGTITLLR